MYENNSRIKQTHFTKVAFGTTSDFVLDVPQYLKHKTENLDITRFLKIHFVHIVLKRYMLYVVYII